MVCPKAVAKNRALEMCTNPFPGDPGDLEGGRRRGQERACWPLQSLESILVGPSLC